MKTYSPQEQEEARKKLPQPLRDFMGSKTLVNIYVGIQKKHDFNLRQLFLFTDIVNMTLLGLETESALETNLHQAMHELSNQGARELVADINDRVFKEAKRWVQENILDPKAIGRSVVEGPELTPEQRKAQEHAEYIMNASVDDPEYIATKKREEEEAKKREETYQKELAEGYRQVKEIEERAKKEAEQVAPGIKEAKPGSVRPLSASLPKQPGATMPAPTAPAQLVSTPNLVTPDAPSSPLPTTLVPPTTAPSGAASSPVPPPSTPPSTQTPTAPPTRPDLYREPID